MFKSAARFVDKITSSGIPKIRNVLQSFRSVLRIQALETPQLEPHLDLRSRASNLL